MTTSLSVHALHSQGLTLRAIAARLGTSDATVWRRLHHGDILERPHYDHPFHINIRKRVRCRLMSLDGERIQGRPSRRAENARRRQRVLPPRPETAEWRNSQAITHWHKLDRAATFMRNHDRTSSYAAMVFGVGAEDVLRVYNRKYGTRKQLVGPPSGIVLVWS